MPLAINALLAFEKKMCDPNFQPKTHTLEEMGNWHAKGKNMSLEAATVLLKRGVKAINNGFVNSYYHRMVCIYIYI